MELKTDSMARPTNQANTFGIRTGAVSLVFASVPFGVYHVLLLACMSSIKLCFVFSGGDGGGSLPSLCLRLVSRTGGVVAQMRRTRYVLAELECAKHHPVDAKLLGEVQKPVVA